MNCPLIYLAGPISGLTYDGCTDWREGVERTLSIDDFEVASPMRAKKFLNTGGIIDDVNPTSGSVLCSAQGIMTRDSWDVHRCDAVFANLLGSTIVSIGTVMELAWAWKAGIPAIVIMEPNNIHQHVMLAQATPFYGETVDEGLELLYALFL